MRRVDAALHLTLSVAALAVVVFVPGCYHPFAPAAEPPGQDVSLESATIELGGATIEIQFASGHLELTRKELVNWVSAAAQAVTDYYGRFPVRESRIRITPVEGRSGVLSGTTWGRHPAFTSVYLGELTSAEELRDDWVMTHEMVHYAFPSMADEHHWIEEGLATYVEPIARLEAGQIRAAKVWGDLVHGLPFGLPGLFDEGLDHTHTWGRTYWGGAMFCLLADVHIRRATGNRYGLRDALRAIVDSGGTIETSWPIAHTLAIGDKAIGVLVLTRLYDEMKAAPVKPDLGDLWSKLGVEVESNAIRFDENAPWAPVRRAIADGPFSG